MIKAELSGREGGKSFNVSFPEGIGAEHASSVAYSLMHLHGVMRIQDIAPDDTTASWDCQTDRFDSARIDGHLWHKNIAVIRK